MVSKSIKKVQKVTPEAPKASEVVSPAAAGESPVVDPARFHKALEWANTQCLEWQQGLYFILLCLIVGRHCLLVGNPGIAKSHTLRVLLSLLSEWRLWKRQVSGDTKPKDFFGFEDLKAFAEGEDRIITTNSILEANVALIQEVPRLQAKSKECLLSLMTKELFHLNPNQSYKADNLTIVGDGNQIEERIAGHRSADPRAAAWAFYDRFTVKLWCQPYLRTEAAQLALFRLGSDQIRGPSATPPDDLLIPGRLIEKLRRECILPMVATAPEDVLKVEFYVIEQFRKAGVRKDVGDRWRLAAMEIAAADAYLRGKTEIDQQALRILRATAPEKQEEVSVVTEILTKFVDIASFAAKKEVVSARTTVGEARAWNKAGQWSQESKIERGNEVKTKLGDSIRALNRLLKNNPDEADDITPLIEELQKLRQDIDVELCGAASVRAKLEMDGFNAAQAN